MAIQLVHVLAWIADLQQVYARQKDYLTALDSAIGDGDHGINLERGFGAVQAELSKAPPPDIGAAFKTVAMALIRTVGGSGPLYGTFFLRASAACEASTELDSAHLVAAFRAGIEGVQQRGKAEADDKTMLDALWPALRAMEDAQQAGADVGTLLRRAAVAAQGGLAHTIALEARKGRASYLGPRSVGHPDPGAASACLLLESAARVWGAL